MSTEQISIVITGHGEEERNRIRYAQKFLEEGVVGIGYIRKGNLNRQQVRSSVQEKTSAQGTGDFNYLHRFIEKIDTGDPIIAYGGETLNHKIVAVGRVTGEYYYDDMGALGSKAPHGLNYPNQRRVSWREAPRYFDQDILPGAFVDKMNEALRANTGDQGINVVLVEHEFNEILEAIRKI